MYNILVLNKNYKQIGILSNQGANPQAPYFDDLYVQELETGANTYQFSTISTPYTQDLLEIGNHITFIYRGKLELFTITSLEYSHNEGYKTIGVYAEGIGFDLLEVYMKRPENEKENSSGGSSSGGSNSGSGGSSSGGGRDEDNDGDDNTDNEYADVDDVYLDENGIIIYDKYGQDDYADPDNVSVDENGVIIYRRNKRNRKKDSLEFKNISYSRFLSILLKNTGWSYVCQPGLESIKHDITVRYDTNIFALLQDSMQSYRGVELEFVYEFVGSTIGDKVNKVIKAYKDGGRGSFVGKRFEYGTNVRGITKTQEVANSEDDTILYIDNVGINVQYDVDFALKSAEVPEIEIGDTHYVIDNDFCPPMQIKARIGKIEISFSDPTVNKIYLANNKRISGSAVEDEFDADDVADMLDDYEYDYGDSGAAYDHYHDRLVSDDNTYLEFSNKEFVPWTANRATLGNEYTPWYDIYTKYMTCNEGVYTSRVSSHLYNVPFDMVDMQNVEKVTNKQDLLDFIVNNINIYEYSSIEIDDIVDAPNDVPYQIYYGILAEDFYNHGDECTVQSEVVNRIAKASISDNTDGDNNLTSKDGHNRHIYNIPALLTALIGAFQHYVNGNSPNAPSDPDNPGNPGGGSYGKLTCEELRVERADGSAAQADIFGKLYVTEEIKCELTMKANTVEATLFDGYQSDLNILRVGEYIQLPDGTKIYGKGDLGGGGNTPSTPSNPSTGSYPNIFDPDAPREDIYVGHVDTIGFNAMEGHIGSLSTTQIYGWNNSASDTIEIHGNVEVIGNITAKNISGGSASGNTFDTITVRKIQGPDPGEGQYNRVDFADGIGVSHIFCTSEDDNNTIFIGDHLALHASMYVSEDIILSEDGGAIVFPDGTRMSSASSFSRSIDDSVAISALQEEIRTRDEKIASLEARLAAIEAMLGINNDN